jgi:hypothetical protein
MTHRKFFIFFCSLTFAVSMVALPGTSATASPVKLTISQENLAIQSAEEVIDAIESSYVEAYSDTSPAGLSDSFVDEAVKTSSNMTHSMVVTKKSGSNIYLSYHSNNTLNRPFSEMKNLNVSWYGHHV